ncbi:hypothetical protein [Legionella drancourtii]|uniref:hypothetical protein n=1 Tax=Legionella drancourtii TaxID=168933 RepID=UPI0011D1DCA8|nr:hypothetical protein [Legionella drancourtii]
MARITYQLVADKDQYKTTEQLGLFTKSTHEKVYQVSGSGYSLFSQKKPFDSGTRPSQEKDDQYDSYDSYDTGKTDISHGFVA